MGDTHDAVNAAPVDGDAAVAGAAHDGEHLVERGVLAHGAHVHARHHDLAGDGVAQVDDLVNHRLLLVGELVGVRDHVLDLVLRDLLAIIGGLHVHETSKAIGARRG